MYETHQFATNSIAQGAPIRINKLFLIAVTVNVVILSLVMLSNDLRNPNIKNKMSKREYIKNTLQALVGLANSPIDSEYLCHAYDNVYLLGHVAPERLDGL